MAYSMTLKSVARYAPFIITGKKLNYTIKGLVGFGLDRMKLTIKASKCDTISPIARASQY